jgi:hypothetical protein
MTDLTPGSADWCRVVTASKVASILGHSPFMSQRSVWHLMRGEYEVETTDAMRRGLYLESGVLAWWRDQHGVDATDESQWAEQPSYRLGDWAAATPDAEARLPEDHQDDPPVLVDAKTSSNDDEWGSPGTDEIPAHYLVSSHWQLHISGYRRVYLPVLTSRLRFTEYVVEADPEVGRLLEQRCAAFYRSLSADTPPPLDDSVSTFECVKRLHRDIEPGLTVDVPPDLALEFVESALAIDADNRRKTAALVELYDMAGRAQYLACNGIRIARRQAKGAAVSIVRTCNNPDLLREPENAA